MRRTARLKAVLVATMVVGGLACLTVPRVYALFSAETRNVQATAASGTLTFNMTVGAGSPCYTKNAPASPGNVNTSCDALFTYSTSMENYPGVVRSANVKITNDGSLTASDLSLYMPGGCTAAATPDAPAAVVGSGNPCNSGGAQLSVQETNSTFTSNTKCWYPTTGTSCSTSSLGLYAFWNNFDTATSALDLGSGPSAQQSRYFVIGVALPSGATNTLQGREATFSLAWHMTS